MLKNNDIVGLEIVEGDFRNKIYTIRGRQVMLDVDLAEIYGYETKNLNRQVSRNKEKFEGEDFMFRLTREELDKTVRCQNGTSRNFRMFAGQEGGSRYLPYVFTEQGVYMLMTVLKGKLAVKQSRMLVMTFKMMKDYIVENKMLLDRRENLNITAKILDNTEQISDAKKKN